MDSNILKIYNSFFQERKNKLYFNELKRLSGLSNSSLQNDLDKLMNSKYIKKQKNLNVTYYKLIDNNFKSLQFTQITLNKINSLNLNVKIPIKEFIKSSLNEIFSIIFFGSASIGNEKNGSDLDVMIILNDFENEKLQRIYEKHIRNHFDELKHRINSRSIYPISLFFVKINDFFLSKDHLIVEARRKGFSIKNQYAFYNYEKK